jgi:MFS family permease
VVRGFVDGARHAWDTVPVRKALATVGVQRLCYGVTTVSTLLLYRNYFTDDGFFRAGLAGLSQLITCLVIGGAVAAVTTPALYRHVGPVRLPATLLVVSAATLLLFVLPYSMPLQLVAALLLGFAAQGIKITVDTLVQHFIDDGYRGRVFTLYDTLFNVAFVLAAVLIAFSLPDDGHSPGAVLVVALVYVLTAAAYVSGSRRTTW